MGNWRTVRIVGTCDQADVETLRKAITTDKDYRNFHPLMGGLGLMGLPMWASEHIDVIGNLAERDYGPGDVARALEYISGGARSLAVKVHCGGEYEDSKCIATVTLSNGKAVVGDPEVDDVGAIPDNQMLDNLASILSRPQ